MSLLQAERTTLAEFYIYEKAYRIKEENIHRNMALQAWFNQTVQATQGSGRTARPKYKRFNDFYDAEKQFELLFNPQRTEPKQLSIADRNRLLNKRGG